MNLRKTTAIATTMFVIGACAIATPARSGDHKILFPQNHAEGALYAAIDRPDIKQYRELYAPVSAIEAAQNGKPLPRGTVITLVQYAVQLGADGGPVKDANGRLIKNEVVGYTVMEKRAGWGAEHPDDIRNGEWEYQAFTADRGVNKKANLSGCMNCHKQIERQDFVFSYEKMKSYTRSKVAGGRD